MALIDPIADKLGHQLRRCASMMAADLVRTTRVVNMKPAEAVTLHVIAANPGRSQVTTGRILDVRRANLTPHIARLHDLKLIRQKPGKGKAIAVTATAKGMRKSAVIGRLLNQHEARFRGRLSASERAELLRLLVKLRGTEPLE